MKIGCERLLRIIAAAILVILSLVIPEGGAMAEGESSSNPIHVAESQSFSLSLEPRYNFVYYTFTPPRDGLYAVEAEGTSDYGFYRYTENWSYLNYGGFNAGKGRFTLGQLEKGAVTNFAIFNREDDLAVTARVIEVPPFSYEVLPDGTASITDVAVSGDIVFPDTIDGYTVTNLAGELLYGRRGITSAYVPATVTYFGTSNTDIDFDYVFSYCYDLVSITVDPENPAYKSVDGVLYTKNGGHLVNYPCARPGEKYHTDAYVLSCTSFASNKYLKYLYLNDSSAYWMGYTFYNTPDLTVYYIPGGYTETRALDFMESHSGDSSWCTFQPLNSAGPDLVLPPHLTVIRSQAFAGIRNVVIEVPDSVTQIEADAFDPSVSLICSQGSAAEEYCIENGLNCILR